MSAASADIVVRRARSGEAEEVARNPALRVLPERLAELETAADTALFVADRDARLAGTVLVALCADVMFGRRPFAVVEGIVVDAPARRRPQARFVKYRGAFRG